MGTERQWILKEAADGQTVSRLATELGIDPVLAELLVQRNIRSFEEARAFFRPKLEDLHDPFLMKDMDKAVDRLTKAVQSGEKILIYGDYDVDGTTAVALMYSFLLNHTRNIDYYIPDRYNEGYGVSFRGIDWAEKNGFSLTITLDCGIKASDKVLYASSKVIDMIICDHHLPEDGLPQATAVLDPKREDDSYPFDDLSGCGVGFKLAQGYALRHGIPFEELESQLDILALSIAADLVSVVGENRILAYYGLKRLNTNPRVGLTSMINITKLDPCHISFDDIVFKIGPRLNAAGRMESGELSVKLLIATSQQEAEKVANEINRHNTERKNIDHEITEQALSMVREGKALSSANITIVYNPNWHKGVVGIVASRLVETYFKPAIVLTQSNGLITGSARSAGGFDLYTAIESCSELLENFGGHLFAAGLTLREEKLKDFVGKMEQAIEGKFQMQSLTPAMEIDAKLEFDQITPKFVRILKQFQPFGPGNSAPVFASENVYDDGNCRKVGADGSHLKLELMQGHVRFSAIGFGQSAHFDYIKESNPFDCCYSIVENYFRGMANIQLRIKDIHEKDDIF